MIPKIIHHIAPKDTSIWHPLWKRCYPSWVQQFNDFDFMMWNDESDIDNLICDYYPQYFDLYNDFEAHIMKIDFARFCILHKYGGIYSDLDVYCYKNFYNELCGGLFILEAPYGDVLIENALMASIKGHNFWKKCMQECETRFYKLAFNKIDKRNFINDKTLQRIIMQTTGPCLIADMFTQTKNVSLLPGILFNNHGLSYHSEYRTKHLLTGIWGKEVITDINANSTFSEVYMDSVSKYANVQNVTIDNLNFYHDYTNGGYLTQGRANPEKLEKSNFEKGFYYD